MIELQNVSKTFRVFDRRQGLVGAVKDLFHRRYRDMTAVADVSFQIKPGEMVGYIGANGAGKSTTIKMLTGILYPSSGSVKAAGYVPHEDRINYLRKVGVVFGQRTQLWWDLAVQESFRLLQKIYDVSEADYEKRMKRFDEVMGINAYLRTPVRKLSLGEKMRCELAAALLHHPEVVFLDEPTIGLDVVAKEAIRHFLKEMNKELGVTVILTTHDLKDIEELCRRVIIIDKGTLVYDGGLEDLRRRLGDHTKMKFHLSKEPVQEDIQTRLNGQKVQWASHEGNILSAEFNPQSIGKADVIRSVLDHFDVQDITMEETSIEDVVKKVYESGGVAVGNE